MCESDDTMASYYIDHDIVASATMWTMRDGSSVLVRDMSDGHLLNAARMVLRNARNNPRIEVLRLYGFMQMANVPMPNGTYAREAVENEIDREGERIGEGDHDDGLMQTVSPIYAALRAEIEQRGLTFAS